MLTNKFQTLQHNSIRSGIRAMDNEITKSLMKKLWRKNGLCYFLNAKLFAKNKRLALRWEKRVFTVLNRFLPSL